MITHRAVQRKECDSVPPSIGFHGRGVEGEPFLGFTPLQLTMRPLNNKSIHSISYNLKENLSCPVGSLGFQTSPVVFGLARAVN